MYKEYERMSITDMFHPGSLAAPGERIIRGNAVNTVHSASSFYSLSCFAWPLY